MTYGEVEEDQKERFLSPELTLSSLRNVLRYHTNTKEALEHFQSTSRYTQMKKCIGLIPIENLKHGDTSLSQAKSFSLFDFHFPNSAGTSLLHNPPPNIRDILEETDRTILLSKCLNSKVEDLILGFNTTEEEVRLLGDLLYDQLLLEESTRNKNSQEVDEDESSSFLKVHFDWLNQSISQMECVFFGFILSRNVLLVQLNVHCHSETNIELHSKFCSSLMKILSTQMTIWNDTNTFQNPWLDIVYILLIAFRVGNASKKALNLDFYTIWAKHELVQGEILKRMMACVSSWSDLLFLCHDTGFMAFLMQNTNTPAKNDDDTIRYNHSHSILRYILLHTSAWMLPYPEDHTLDTLREKKANVPLLLDDLVDIHARVCNRFEWIGRKVSQIHTVVPSPENIHMLLKPFLLAKSDTDCNLIVCVHVLKCCSKNNDLLDQVLLLAFPKDSQRMDRERLKFMIHSQRDILNSPYQLHETCGITYK